MIFSKTAGFRHESIGAGRNAITRLGLENGFKTEASESSDIFQPDRLLAFRAVIFLHTTGDVLTTAQQVALEDFIRVGGGFVGIHSAADTEYEWPWYGGLIGAYFDNHPDVQPATVSVVDTSHPSTAKLPERWPRNDEWYNFRSNPRGRVRILAAVDEQSYSGGQMGADHPVVWCHEYIGGRSWYTALGHSPESLEDEDFLGHLLGGIVYAAGFQPGDCTPN